MGDGGGEGSSTESQSHMHQGMAPGLLPAGTQYVDTVVDSQYVLIEASPPVGTPCEAKISPKEKGGGGKANKPRSKLAKV